MTIAVLRLGHRLDRDHRITTHIGLVARAFGADVLYVTSKDKGLEQSISKLTQRFGGEFSIHTGVKAKKICSEWEGIIIHLTMYGMPIEGSIKSISTKKDILIIVGAEKVPGYIYGIADYNIAVGNQPHSEIAALAIFLDRITQSSWQQTHFTGEVQVIPCERGKKLVERAHEEK